MIEPQITFTSELKAKWLEALRSGRYRQGQGLLRPTPDHFCCLGVLADVVDPEVWEVWDDDDGDYTATWRGADSDFSIQQRDPTEPPRSCLIEGLSLGDHDVLTSVNDSGRSFAEIADHIEEHCPPVES